MASPRILMIAPYCYPPTCAEAIVNAKLALAMREAGWQVDVVTCHSDDSKWYPSEHDTWRDLTSDLHVVRIKECTWKARLRNVVEGLRLTGLLLQSLAGPLSIYECAYDLVLHRDYDVVLSRSYPFSAHIAALMLSRQTHIPWVANWNDPIPGRRFPAPYGEGPKAYVGRYYEVCYKAIGDYCSWHTFPCERLRQYMCSYLPERVRSISSVIPHVALRRFCATGVPPMTFTLCHAGHLQSPRDPGVLFRGLRRFADTLVGAADVHLRLVGDLSDTTLVGAKAAGVDHLVSVEPARPYGEMPHVLAAADVLVLIEAPVEEGIFLPSKFVDYLQAGRPILAVSPVDGTVADLLNRHGGGIAADCRSAESVTQALRVLYGHWKENRLDEVLDTTQMLSHFNEDAVLARWVEVCERVLVHGHSGLCTSSSPV